MIFGNLVEDNEEYDFNPLALRALPLSATQQRENTSRYALGRVLGENPDKQYRVILSVLTKSKGCAKRDCWRSLLCVMG